MKKPLHLQLKPPLDSILLICHFIQRFAAADGESFSVASIATSRIPSLAWARRVIAESLARMQAECSGSGRADVWGVFECRLLAPMLDGAEPMPYEALVERFALRSPAQASNVLITGKRMFERALRAVVGEYVADEAEVDEEIAELRQILARGGA